jgi:pimeloyl-ACP methyl ester carboxylesterase
MADSGNQEQGTGGQVIRMLGKSFLFLLALPLVLVAVALYIVFVVLFVCTGAGPLWEYYASRREKAGVLSRESILALDKDLKYITVRGHQLAVRITHPPPGIKPRSCPVCIPNGMAATMAMIGRMQENLRDEGFTVLSYDRYGCGFSDSNTAGIPPTVEETVADMDEVMRAALPEDEETGQRARWIIVGPSMGSIVAQSYMARHPDGVAGFLNLDGLPYPFFRQRRLFDLFGKVYWLEAHIVWTGLLRFFVRTLGAGMLRRHFAGECYKADTLLAQACVRRPRRRPPRRPPLTERAPARKARVAR